jgi:hypothetical protein
MAEVLSLRQFAERYGLSANWIKSQVKAGRLPHLRAGSRLLFNPTAVAEALSRMAAVYPKTPEPVGTAPEVHHAG